MPAVKLRGRSFLFFSPENTAVVAEKVERARKILEQLQQGKIDRSLFTDNANSYFDQQALQDFATGLGPLGTSQDFQQTAEYGRGGMTYRAYRAKFAEKVLIDLNFRDAGRQDRAVSGQCGQLRIKWSAVSGQWPAVSDQWPVIETTVSVQRKTGFTDH